MVVPQIGASVLQFPCHCAQCIQCAEGFKYQTRQLIRTHLKNYGKAPAQVEQQYNMPYTRTNGSALTNHLNPNLNPACKNPGSTGTGHASRTNDRCYDDDGSEDDFGFNNNYDANDFLPQLEDKWLPAGNIGAHVHEHHQRPDHNFQPVQPPAVRQPGVNQAQEDQPSLIPPAFKEKPEVWLAYLGAVKSNAFGHATVLQAMEQLNTTLNCLLITGVLPEVPCPVHSLISAKQHLSIDPDVWITAYAICPECWKYHTPAKINALKSPNCSVAGCLGVLYTETMNLKGQWVRTMIKINPQTSLIGSLRWMFMRPRFAKSIATAIMISLTPMMTKTM